MFGHTASQTKENSDKAKDTDRATTGVLLPEFIKFETFFPKFVSKSISSKLQTEARRIKRVFWDAFSLDKLRNRDNVSVFIQESQQTLTQEGVSDSTIEKAMFAFLFASQSNVPPPAFWLLLHLMKDPEAMNALRREAEKVVKESGRRRPNLDTPPLAVHTDPEVHPDPHTFKYDRFLNPDGTKKKDFYKKGKRVKYYTAPWGGGLPMCPGRFFAINELKQFVFHMLVYFDFELLNPDEKIPSYKRPVCPGTVVGIWRCPLGVGWSSPSPEATPASCTQTDETRDADKCPDFTAPPTAAPVCAGLRSG
ncbi:hypothetical protein WMY93_022875 [Mugilogobius chulae]|uniref:Uncharacterized protein n=1 Tax=Mugilogobius chulae TaxID=88201 RepID=A0AAW0NEU6_9GOBI